MARILICKKSNAVESGMYISIILVVAPCWTAGAVVRAYPVARRKLIFLLQPRSTGKMILFV